MDRIEFAAAMEQQAEQFYQTLAKEGSDNQMKSIFSVMADEERTHLELLSGIKTDQPYVLNNTHSEIKNLFDEIGDYKSLTGPLTETMENYQTSIEMEKDSIGVYREYLSSAKEEKEKEILKYIIEQEEEHLMILQCMVNHNN